jgi:DNA-binding NtrC family response regulator
VDVRVVAATAKDLERAVAQGEFRDDLYYRLNVVRLHLPPLRERPQDIPALVAHFARQTAEKLGRPVSLTPRALAALSSHAWPGNVRELRNALERAAVLSATGRLDVEDFSLQGGNGNGRPMNGTYIPVPGTYELKPQIEQLERATIVRALDASKGSRREAAQLLGVSLRTLFYKLRRYRLE